MRPGRGCVSCRDRHLKCVTEPNRSTCTRCLEANRDCNFGPRFKFRSVLHVDGAANGLRSRQELTYGRDQVWVSTRKHLNFIIEDGTGLEYGVPEDGEEHISQGAALISSPLCQVRSDLTSDAVTVDGMINGDPAARTRDFYPQTHGVQERAQCNETPLSLPKALATTASFASPASIGELYRRYEERSIFSSSPFDTPIRAGTGVNGGSSPSSLPTLESLSRPNLSRREAFLIQLYIHKIGPWVDVCDLASHFTRELPRRAMRSPMVLYSILAVTSRHLSIVNGDTEQDEASFYHGQCIRLVIEQLSGPESLYNDNLLATVVCMRIYEEIEANNGDVLHLQGTDRLLRAIPSFAHSGGLGEAASWQSLRQDIYVAMLRNQIPSLDLSSFTQSSVFTFRDDAACANVVVLLFAKILRLAYSPEERNNPSSWNSLVIDVESWNDRRLRIFQPIYYEDLDSIENRPFPVIHMMNPPQVAAMQYYHSCKIFLLLHRPDSEQLSHFHAAKKRRAVERDVSYHLVATVGLAQSNPYVENANFTAHHILRVGGYCITHALQRTHIIEFLKHVECVMGWSTSPTIALLKEQWSDLD